MNKRISNKRVEKISILLQEFNIQQIVHVKGKYNCLPDYLSRNPISHEDEFLDYDYGLEFCRTKPNSPIQLLGAVVTRSKSKALSSLTPLPQSLSSLPVTSSPSPTIDPLPHSFAPFDITQL